MRSAQPKNAAPLVGVRDIPRDVLESVTNKTAAFIDFATRDRDGELGARRVGGASGLSSLIGALAAASVTFMAMKTVGHAVRSRKTRFAIAPFGARTTYTAGF